MHAAKLKILITISFLFTLFLIYQIIQIKHYHGNDMIMDIFTKDSLIHKSFNIIDFQSTERRTEEQKQYKMLLKGRKRNLVALSVSVPNNSNGVSAGEWTYVFYIPFTIQSWLQLEYDVILHIVVDFKSISLEAKHLFLFVMKFIEKYFVSVSVYYYDVDSNLRIRLSQLLRIYSASMATLNNSSFMILSDIDLWVLKKSRLEFTAHNKRILITNSECCGTFKHKNAKYKHFPIAHIGMKVYDWMQLFPLNITTSDIPEKLKHFPFLIQEGKFKNYYNRKSVEPLLQHMKEIFGNGVYNEAVHGGPLWSLDQHYVSMVIGDYRNHSGDKYIQFLPKWSCIRVDRSNWENTVSSDKCKADSHLLHGTVWNEKQWKRLFSLVIRVFDKNITKTFDSYRKHFSRLYTTYTY